MKSIKNITSFMHFYDVLNKDNHINHIIEKEGIQIQAPIVVNSPRSKKMNYYDTHDMKKFIFIGTSKDKKYAYAIPISSDEFGKKFHVIDTGTVYKFKINITYEHSIAGMYVTRFDIFNYKYKATEIKEEDWYYLYELIFTNEDPYKYCTYNEKNKK